MSPLYSAAVFRSEIKARRACFWIASCLTAFFPMAVYSQQPLSQPQHQSPQTNPQRQLTAQKPQKGRSAVGDSSNPITPRRGLPLNAREASPSFQSFSIWKMVGVLMLAVAGIFGVAKLLKFWGPFQAIHQLPNSVYDVLGHTTIPPRHTLYLIRIGQKVVLLGATNDNLTNLTEITDPQEIASITTLCQVREESGMEEDSLFARLLKQVKPISTEKNDPPADQPGAREELEARLKSFAHS